MQTDGGNGFEYADCGTRKRGRRRLNPFNTFIARRPRIIAGRLCQNKEKYGGGVERG